MTHAKPIKKISAHQLVSNEPEALWLSAQLNKYSKLETLLFLKKPNGQLLILAEDWQRWHLKPADNVFRYDEQDYYILDELQGVRYQFDAANLSVAIEVDARWFKASVFNASNQTNIPKIQSSVGMYANYELNSSYAEQQTESNLFASATLFHPLGTLENQFLIQHLETQQRQAIRLNTVFAKDDIDGMYSLRVGDTATSSLGLSGGLRYAGIQWGSNFSLQPQLVRFATPSVSGQALLPSTVDVYINDAKSWTKQIPAGEFTIDNLPVTAGMGEARVIVKDLLGREQTFVLPYYAGADLLKVGLHEYAIDSGFLRQDYGIQSNQYDDFFAMAAYRRGLTDKLTADVQLQWQQHQQMLKLATAFVPPKLGLVNVWLAQSRQRFHQNALAYGVEIDPQYKIFNTRISWQYQDREFWQIGSQPTPNPLQETLRVFGGVSLKQYGSLRAQYIYTRKYDAPETSSVVAGYGLSLGQYGSLSVSVGRTLQPSTNTQAQISVSIPLQSKQSVSVVALPLEQQYRVAFQQSAPAGNGVGYSLSADIGQIPRTQGAVTWQNSYGSYQLKVSEQNSQYNGSINISGGMALLGGQGFLGRQISSSFAVAKVGDYANVSVYANNHLIGVTNKHGITLVPRLLPYQLNKIRINPSDLPFDAEMTSQEQEIVPANNSGLWVDFGVKRAYAATMTILLDNGQALPAGAEVYKNDSSEAFPVGYRGELYITGLSAKNRLTAHWKGQSCRFEVEFEVVDDSLPDLGTKLCKGVQP
ncbi:MAG: fimbrial biogenesis outer membrane usher protein [Moraxellaceae bacterium]|nr:fimbrial biogenesis outer membrane usher protein [Moraxellaceae bacterium]